MYNLLDFDRHNHKVPFVTPRPKYASEAPKTNYNAKAEDLGLHLLPMSHKKDGMHIWANTYETTCENSVLQKSLKY